MLAIESRMLFDGAVAAGLEVAFDDGSSPDPSKAFAIADASKAFVAIKDVNLPPIANPDVRTIVEPPTGAPEALYGNVIFGLAPGEQADSDPENGTISMAGVRVGDIDAGNPMPKGGVGSLLDGEWGTLVVQVNGAYVYRASDRIQTLRGGEVAEDVFTYTICDPIGNLASSTLTIRLLGVNEPPLALPDANSAPADASATADGNVVAGGSIGDRADQDPDPDDTLRVVAVASGEPAELDDGGVGSVLLGRYGELLLESDGTYRYLANAADDTLRALGPGDSVDDVFSYRIVDDEGLSSRTTLTIRVEGRNDPPAGEDRSFSISQDLFEEDGVPLSFTVIDFGYSDPDPGDDMRAVRIDSIPASGQLLLSGQALEAGQIVPLAQIPQLAYVPAEGANRDNLAAPPAIRFSVQDSREAFDPQPNTFLIDIAPSSLAPPPASASAPTLLGEPVALTRGPVPADGGGGSGPSVKAIPTGPGTLGLDPASLIRVDYGATIRPGTPSDAGDPPLFASAFPVRQSQVKSVVFENTAADDDCVPEKQRPAADSKAPAPAAKSSDKPAGLVREARPTRPANFSHQLDNEKKRLRAPVKPKRTARVC